MKKLLLLLFLILTLPFSVYGAAQHMRAEVTKVEKNTVGVRIEEGSMKGKTFTVPLDTTQGKALTLRSGDDVIVSYEKVNNREQVYVIDVVRDMPLALLFVMFLMLVFVVGRRKGITSFIGMIFSFVIIMNFIIPQILVGNDPVLISLFGALFIIPITFYLSHGINKQTTVAMGGTFFSLALTALLAYGFILFTKLTGFAAEEAVYIQTLRNGAVNITSLLLAGIIIGAMGVLDDITVSQTSIVNQLSAANPKFTFMELYKRAMIVGRDHIASLVNTLVLVYAGASLPLFLLFYNTQMTYMQVINQEIVATEIVRTLVSSIGIIAAVPFTTFLACMFLKNK